jgi:lipopolysaccharide biosynthesis glycosyltransferase
MLDIALGFDSRYARHARVVIESLLAAESPAEHPATVRLWC